MSLNAAPEPLPTSFVLKRRLLGLLVLLLFLFLLSVLLRGLGQPRESQEDGLQTVVVPLGSGELPPAVASPEPEAPVEEAASEPPAEPAAAPAPEPEPIRELPPAPAREAAPKPAPTPPPSKPAKPVAEKPVAKTPPVTAPTAKTPVGPARWYIVLGSFSDAANAKALALRARQSGFKAEVLPMKSGRSSLNRVRVGPFKTEAEGQGARATLIVEGMTGAKLVKEP